MKKKNNNWLFSLISVFILFFCCTSNTFAFTRIVDLVFDGMSVEADKLDETLATIKQNKAKNKTIFDPAKRKPDKLFVVKARQKDPQNIQLEIDTSGVLVKNENDIQASISNQGFLDAIQESVNLWESVDVAEVMFAPLKFASGQANPDDGRNIISFRAVESPEGVAQGSAFVSIIAFARSENVLFMNKAIMVKPGTILDADVIFDPTNDPCLALHTTKGAFKTGGDDSVPISEGGIDPTADLSTCTNIGAGDITDFAVESIGSVLGLDNSPIASSATSFVTQIRTRYALTTDDKIGLANIYPNKNTLINHGSIAGKVLLKKKPVRGAHVVLEDSTTGQPITSTITDINGNFLIAAISAGIYKIYAEPLDGPTRKNTLARNFFGFASQINFTTGTLPSEILIRNKKTTKVTINVQELSASAFNINYIGTPLTESDIEKIGGGFLLPIMIMAGETLTDVQFWGSNISKDFGTLSVSGSGITVSNVTDASIPISPFIRCSACEDTPYTMCKRDPRCPATDEITAEPDQIQGITANITCAASASPGPRNIIFTGNKVDPTHPSFGLIDQITGGIIVTED